MSDIDQYRIKQEPFYQAQHDEISLYQAACDERLPVMIKGPAGCGKSHFAQYPAGQSTIEEIQMSAKNRGPDHVYTEKRGLAPCLFLIF